MACSKRKSNISAAKTNDTIERGDCDGEKSAQNKVENEEGIVNLTARNLPGFSVQDIPRQKNGWDCGIYIALYMEIIVEQLEVLDTSFFYVMRSRKEFFKNIKGSKLFGENDVINYRKALMRYLESFGGYPTAGSLLKAKS